MTLPTSPPCLARAMKSLRITNQISMTTRIR